MPESTPASKTDLALYESASGGVARSLGPSSRPEWEATATDGQAAAPSLDVEVEGDSLSAGFGTTNPATDSWPAKLAASTGRIINDRAVNASTSADVLDRIEANPSRTDKPLILMVGRNDVFPATPLATTMANIASVVALQNGMGREQLMIVGTINKRDEQIGSAVYTRMLAFHAALLAAYPDNFYDLQADLLAQSTAEDQALGLLPPAYFFDGLHFNNAGTSAVFPLIGANCPFPLEPGPDPLLTAANLPAIGASPCVLAPGAKMHPRTTPGAILYASDEGNLDQFGSYDRATRATTFPGQVNPEGILAVLETRAMGLAAGDTVELGDISWDVQPGGVFSNSGEGDAELRVAFFGIGVSLTKVWEVPATYAGTGGVTWLEVPPRADTGPGVSGDDWALQVLQFQYFTRFRLQRIAGTTACTAHAQITATSGQLVRWTASTTTAGAQPRTPYYLAGVSRRFPGPIIAPSVQAATVQHEQASTIALDVKAGPLHFIRLTGDTTLTFSNLGLGNTLDVLVYGLSGGVHAITWPPNIVWPGGAPPTLSGLAKFDEFQIKPWLTNFYRGTITGQNLS